MGLVSRFGSRRVYKNRHPAFEWIFEDRGLKYIRQYASPRFFSYPTERELQTLFMLNHLWKAGDRYDKLAEEHYGDPEMRWVIAWINKKPAEFLLQPGDIIAIPTPIEHVLEFLGV